MASLLAKFIPGPRLIDGTDLNNLLSGATGFSGLSLGGGAKTATAVAGAATLNNVSGSITSEPLTTAAGADYVLTLTDSSISSTSQVFVSVALGTATTGAPAVIGVKPAAGSVVITIQNVGTVALNGTIVITFMVLIA